MSGFPEQLIGKKVEIYQGDTHESLLKADKDIERKSVLCGILDDVSEDWITLTCDVKGHPVVVYIHTWTVCAILEIQYGICINNIYKPAERKRDD